MQASAAPTVVAGAHLAQRLFDVAFAIDLPHAQAAWQAAQANSRRSALQATLPRALSFEVVPLQLELGTLQLEVAGAMRSLEASATVYDFGVVALSLRWALGGLGWDAFSESMHAYDAALGGDSDADAIWNPLLERVCSGVAAALDRPTHRHLTEDYLYAIVNAVSTPMDAQSLQQAFDIPRLLSGESRALSPGERQALMSRAFSYFSDDLVVLAWDRAFVYEPRKDADVIGIIEIANAQLVELRYYDELLDDELPPMYDLVEDTRGGLFASRRASRLARKLHALVAEVTEITERVENALHVTEDVYLARIHTAALELFRVPKLSAAVDRKLGIIRDTYTALHDEAHGRRAEVLEIAIVLLIVIEIVMAVVRH